MASPTNYAAPTYQTGASLTRPVTVTLAFLGALVAGAVSLLGAILLMTGATDAVMAQAAADLGVDPATLTAATSPGDFDSAANILHSRALIAIVISVVVLLLALAARNAATWARLVLTLALLASVGLSFVVVRNVAPTATKLLDIVAILLSLGAVVVLFLGPTNRYARARRTGTAA